ncbi:tape measure protein [Halopseudomonas bauzanensis]|uniref:tape measure protein n=1 Tax=Halopseudomonas bauzanensis TaxID=653930 RepID=UPI002552EB9B|nr:tape measure protein [Halopseudomonas bauzanensis]
MSIKDRLIQYVFRGKNELSPEARKIAEDLDKVRNAGKELSEELDKAKGAQGLAAGLRGASEASERARSTLERTEKRAADLREELNQNPGSKGLATSLRIAEREAAKAARELDRLTAETKRAEDAAQAAGIDTRRLAEEEKRLAAEVDRAKVAVTENTKQLRDLERQQRAASRAAAEHKSRVDSVRDAMSSGAKQALAFAAAYVSLNAAFGLVQKGLNLVRDGIRSMLDTGSEFELMQQRVNGLMGSIEAGEQATAWISQFAKETGQLIPDVTEAFALLKAYGLDPMDGSLKAITDKSVQLGGGMERLSGITAALGQMWAKEKIQQEEVLQLTERGVVVWPLLEKAMGKTTAQLQDMAQKGLLGRDAVKLLIDEIGRSAEGAAAAGLDTLQGKMNGLRNAASEFLNRIAESGAMDAVKERLSGLADQIDRMDQDGTLENLAQALSNAFVQGIEKVEEFAHKLREVDFKQLADDAAAWFNQFESHVDSAVGKFNLLIAPLRIGTNLVTGFFSAWVAGLSWTLSKSLAVVGTISKAIPDMLGGAALEEAVAKARKALDGLTEGAADQLMQDYEDIRSAWSSALDGIAGDAEQAQAEIRDSAKAATSEQMLLGQALADHLVANQQRVKDAAIEAAIAGTQSITDMADAMRLIDSASAVQQLEGLKEALQDAYRSGTISQEEYNAGLNLTNERIQQLGGSAGAAANNIDEVVKSLGDLNDVQDAIKSAKTDVDINKLAAAIRKMYADGKLTADEYKQAMEALEKQKGELKKATDEQSKSEQGLASSIDLVAKALEEKAAKERAAQQAADDAAAQRAQEMAAWGGYFDSVMTAAREPLAALSEQALAAFDSIRGITTTDMAIDTSGIEATRASMERLRESMAATQRELDDNLRGPFARWASEQIHQSQKIQAEYLQQKLSLQQLMEAYESGSITLQGFRNQAANIRNSLTLLDESDLSQLDSALASVKQQMEAVGDSARGTLDSLRDELDRLRGDEEAIERRRMASRRRDLQAQLAEARAAGNTSAVSDLTQAISMLSAIESEQQLAREEEARKNRREAQAAQAPGTQQASTTAPTTPATVIRLETTRGQAVDLSVPTGQEQALLGILEQAGLRSI